MFISYYILYILIYFFFYTLEDNSQELQKLKERNAASRWETKVFKDKLALQDKLHKKQLMQNMENKLTPFFTPGQVKILLNPTRHFLRIFIFYICMLHKRHSILVLLLLYYI